MSEHPNISWPFYRRVDAETKLEFACTYLFVLFVAIPINMICVCIYIYIHIYMYIHMNK